MTQRLQRRTLAALGVETPPAEGQYQGVETHADGFTMSASLRFLPKRYYALAVSSLYDIRTSISHRPKSWLVPRDSTVPIPLMSTFTEQVKMVRHSVIWGFGFAAVNGTITDFTVDIEDPVAEYRLFQYPIGASYFRAGTNGAANLFPVILSEPYVVNEQGVMVVRITNQAVEPLRCQLVIYVAEPCAG